MKRIVITSDLQIPYHNSKQLRSHLRFIRDWQPDQVINIGDLTDLPQPSRWNKDTRGEFESRIYDDIELTKKLYFGPLREYFSGPVGMHIGNHDSRALDYQKRYAPALDHENDTDSPYHYANLIDFNAFGVEDLGRYYDIAPGWLSTHGHLGIPLRQVAGGTALAGARKYGKSIVCGHTHRAGIVHETIGWGEHTKTLTGFEVGNMMDKSKADYIQRKGGYANWQSGWGILWVDGRTVRPEWIPVNQHGEFLFEGKRWK